MGEERRGASIVVTLVQLEEKVHENREEKRRGEKKERVRDCFPLFLLLLFFFLRWGVFHFRPSDRHMGATYQIQRPSSSEGERESKRGERERGDEREQQHVRKISRSGSCERIADFTNLSKRLLARVEVICIYFFLKFCGKVLKRRGHKEGKGA